MVVGCAGAAVRRGGGALQSRVQRSDGVDSSGLTRTAAPECVDVDVEADCRRAQRRADVVV